MKRSVSVIGIALVLSLACTLTALACAPMSGQLADCPGCYVFTGPFSDSDYIQFGGGCTPCNTTAPHLVYTVVLEGDWNRTEFNNEKCWCEQKKMTTVSCSWVVNVEFGYKGCFTAAYRRIDSVWCYMITCAGSGCFDKLREVEYGDCYLGPVEMIPCLA